MRMVWEGSKLSIDRTQQNVRDKNVKTGVTGTTLG